MQYLSGKECETARNALNTRSSALLHFIYGTGRMQGLDQQPVQTSMITLSLSPRERVDCGKTSDWGITWKEAATIGRARGGCFEGRECKLAACQIRIAGTYNFSHARSTVLITDSVPSSRSMICSLRCHGPESCFERTICKHSCHLLHLHQGIIPTLEDESEP